MRTHFLHEFLKPKSIAIYGANHSVATTMGSMLLSNLIIGGFDGNIYPIHLKLDSVFGYKAYKSISEVPEVPDLVIIVLPPRVVPQIFEECGEKGVKKIVLISGGFREVTGELENDLTEQITKLSKKYNIRFIGPNCLGFYNAWAYPETGDKAFNLMIFSKQTENGRLSLASQSGTMTSHIFMDPENTDVHIGKSVSIGNEANIDLVDFLEYFKDDSKTDVIGLYIEEIKRSKEFIEVAKKITPNKPIIALYGGGSKAGNRAIMSHTGSMSGNSRLFDSMVKTTGIIKTDYVKEFLDLAGVLSKKIYPKGKRIGIITNSGGPGALIATNAEKIGLEIPIFSESLQKTLKSMVPPTGSYKNPIDVTFDMDMFNFYSKMPKVLMKSGEIDLIIIYGVIGFHYLISNYTKNEQLAPYVELNHELLEKVESLEEILIKPVLKASKRFSIPIFYINPENFNSQWSRKIRDSGAILFQYWDAPVSCAAKLCDYAEFRRNHSSKLIR